MVATWTPAVVAAAAGLAVLAYYRADIYDSLAIYVMAGLVVMFCFALCWSMAVMRTFIRLLPLIEESSSDSAARVRDRLAFRIDRLAFICGCVLLFLWLLTLLPAPQ
jgi:hypothetical protein